jgi:hypothetical protein
MPVVRPLLTILLTISIVGVLPAFGSRQTDFGSVDVSPTYQELSVGGIADFTIGASSSSGGTVLVNIQTGLDLLGSPICYSGCRVPMVTYGNDATTIEFNIDGQVASIGIRVAVGYSVTIGSSLHINATLVGGPQAVEMSSATIFVTDAVPTQPPPVSERTPVSTIPPPLEDNREVFLDVWPSNLRLSPEGEVLYIIQTGQWGTWEGQIPDFDISITLPASVEISSTPGCGTWSTIELHDPCETQTAENPDGTTTLTLQPGYDRDGAPNLILLPISLGSRSEIGSSHHLLVSAQIDDVTLANQPAPIEANMMVVEREALLSSQAPDTVSAVIEFRTGFTKSRSQCFAQSHGPDVELGLYEIGLEGLLSTTTSTVGVLGEATDGSGTEVCHFVVDFEDVPSRLGYVMASGADSNLGPCRACVFGLVTTTEGGEQVFILMAG